MSGEGSLPNVPGYRTVRMIGAGGMGAVFEVEKLATHERFALKVMSPLLAADATHVKRFEREVRVLRDIRHPNVVDVYEWSLPPPGSPDRACVVMELLEGETLQALLKRETMLSPWKAVAVMLQVLDGLAAAHRVGVVHRDIAPSNVFLVKRPDRSFHVKLLDFGLARSTLRQEGAGSLTEPGALMGRAAYVPPELFLGQRTGEAGDVFSAGMVLHRLIAGRLPHKETTPQMLWAERFADRDSRSEYPSPRLFVPSIPEPLADIVSRAIRKRVDDRIPSAREFQHQLLKIEAMLVDPTVPATRLPSAEMSLPKVVVPEIRPRPSVSMTSVTERVVAGRRRGRAGWIAAAAVVAGAAAAAVLWLLLRSPAGAPERPGPTVDGPQDPADAAAAAAEVTATTPPRGAAATGPDVVVSLARLLAAGDIGAMAAAFPGGGVAGPDAGGFGPDAGGAEPDAGDAGPDLPPAGPDAAGVAPDAPRTVRFTFAGFPPGARAFVDDRAVGPAGFIDLPLSDRKVRVVVRDADDRRDLFRGRLAPDAGRTIRPAASAPAPDARSGVRDDAGAAARDVRDARDIGRFTTYYPGREAAP